MKLTIELPAPAAEIRRFLDAADLLDLPTIAADTSPSPDALIARAADEAPATVAPYIPSQVTTTTAGTPEKVAKVAKRAPRTTPAPTSPRKGTTCTSALLHHLADLGGTWEGSSAELARSAYPQNPATAATQLRKMEADRLISADRVNNRVRSITIATAGRAAIGRDERAKEAEVRSIVPTAVVPRVVDLDAGPMERRSFDPDKARANAASAL